VLPTSINGRRLLQLTADQTATIVADVYFAIGNTTLALATQRADLGVTTHAAGTAMGALAATFGGVALLGAGAAQMGKLFV
jgi:hypothetical protein